MGNGIPLPQTLEFEMSGSETGRKTKLRDILYEARRVLGMLALGILLNLFAKNFALYYIWKPLDMVAHLIVGLYSGYVFIWIFRTIENARKRFDYKKSLVITGTFATGMGALIDILFRELPKYVAHTTLQTSVADTLSDIMITAAATGTAAFCIALKEKWSKRKRLKQPLIL